VVNWFLNSPSSKEERILQKDLHKHILCCDASIRKRMKPCSRSVPSEKANSRNQVASVETLFGFNVPKTSKNTERSESGSSNRVSPNWDCCTIEIRVSLSSNFWASTFGRLVSEVMPWTPGVTKS